MESDGNRNLSRRAVLAMPLLAAGLPILEQPSLSSEVEVKGEVQGTAPRPFRVNIPEATIKHILSRVRDARWPDRLDATDWRYGANWDYMKALAQYWTTRYDWRKAEASLNRYPQFLARVGAFAIHFYHVKGEGPNPVPLILTHGWPGSVLEFLEAIGPLSDPQRFGGSPAESFNVVVPSVPGFGFSSKPSKPIGAPTTATLWHRLMTDVLGYSKYGAQGGDLGSGVTAQLARQYPDSLLGVHFNRACPGAFLLGLFRFGRRRSSAPEAEQTEEERAWARTVAAFVAAERDYFNEHQHKP